MTSSKPHERIKTMIGRMLELWSLREGIPLHGFGQYTLENPALERAAEADECYVLGDPDKEPPDLAIEVIWTHGGLDKLEIYRGLGVRELWLWNDGEIEVHVLKRGRYSRREHSELLPGFDLKLVKRLLGERDQLKALRSFEAALERRKKH
jgi:Uma2 family endonuclease